MPTLLELKKMIIRAKLTILAIQTTLENLRKEPPLLVKKASERKAAGDKREAVWLMLKRRGILIKIQHHEKNLGKLIEARDQWVI